MELEGLARHLEEVEPGLWAAPTAAEVSYPADGHRVMVDIEDESFWFQHRAEVVATVLRRFPPPGCLFDLGGGNGFMVRALRSRGWDAIVVEPRPEGVRNSLARNLTPVVRGTFSACGFLPDTLPAVGLFDVLEHLQRPVEFLTRVRRALYPDGRLYLTVPAYRVLWSVDDVRAGHYRRYSLRSISRELGAAGFEVEYSSYFFLALPIPVFLVRTMPSLLGLRSGEASRQREHRASSSLGGKTLRWALKREFDWISHARLWAGSSLMVVARPNESGKLEN